jgi:hypothetical protein
MLGPTLAIVLSLITVSAVRAQSTASGQGQLLRYGTVDVRKLPPSRKTGAKVTQHRRHHVDADAFELEKARVNAASLSSVPVLRTTTAPGISIGPAA